MKPADTSSAELVTFSVRLTEDVANRLKAVAARDFRPVAATIRRLIVEYVEQAEADQAGTRTAA